MHFSWDSALAGSHDVQALKFLIEGWLEKTFRDASEYECVPLYSALGSLANLRHSIPLFLSDVLGRSSAHGLAEEAIWRLERPCWLSETYPLETKHICRKLSQLCNTQGQKEYRDLLKDLDLILEAFDSKIRLSAQERQRTRLAQLVPADGCDHPRLKMIEAALDEMITDALLVGHSRDYLYRWMQRNVVGRPGERPDTAYLDRFRAAPPLGRKEPYVVFVPTDLPERVSSTDIQVVHCIPNEFRTWAGYAGTIQRVAPPERLDADPATSKRWLILHVEACDPLSAIEEADELARRLFATRFAEYRHTMEIRGLHPVALSSPPRGVFQGAYPPTLGYQRREPLANAGLLFSPRTRVWNKDTAAKLEKSLYWYNLSGAPTASLESRFVGLWTACESLFSGSEKSATANQERFFPPYVVLSWMRGRLLNAWSILRRVSPATATDLLRTPPAGISGVDLVRFWVWCRAISRGEMANPPEELETEPTLLFRIGELGMLHPNAEGGLALRRFLEHVKQQVIYDIRAVYRVRNKLVHEAAIGTTDLERAFKRLDFYVRILMEQLLFRFHRNASLSLEALHAAFREQLELLKRDDIECEALSLMAVGGPAAFLGE